MCGWNYLYILFSGFIHFFLRQLRSQRCSLETRLLSHLSHTAPREQDHQVCSTEISLYPSLTCPPRAHDFQGHPGPPLALNSLGQQMRPQSDKQRWLGFTQPHCAVLPTTGSGSFLYQRLLLMADLQAKISSDELAGKCPWTLLYPSKTGNLHRLFKCWGRGWHSWWTNAMNRGIYLFTRGFPITRAGGAQQPPGDRWRHFREQESESPVSKRFR